MRELCVYSRIEEGFVPVRVRTRQRGSPGHATIREASCWRWEKFFKELVVDAWVPGGGLTAWPPWARRGPRSPNQCCIDARGPILVADLLMSGIAFYRFRRNTSRLAESQLGLNTAHPIVKRPQIIANGEKTSPPNQFV